MLRHQRLFSASPLTRVRRHSDLRCCRCSSLTMLFCQRRRRSLPPPADQHRYQRPLRIGRPSNDRLVPGTPIGELPVEATAFTVLVLYSPLDSNSVKHFGAAEFSLSLGKAFLIIPTLALYNSGRALISAGKILAIMSIDHSAKATSFVEPGNVGVWGEEVEAYAVMGHVSRKRRRTSADA